ncbi:LarC family nickel insertion protein [Oceaniglobus trochenteri]|uniref:LarC family nickel insertion protein n=1 Tax=Oceaniglobus trochenteri TaxID=2763260 RepID=UPI001CFFF977|nr:LarC family nickel insertion protein [Oceaniglobus trochenteri]
MSGHIHIAPLGGISGDMFASAMLSLLPGAEAALRRDLGDAGILDHVTLNLGQVRKAGFAALQVSFTQSSDAPPTSHWRDIRAFLQGSNLRAPVKARAIAIFALLAEAEAACHGIDIESVHFHEIADWDSLADITAAASLIETSGATGWSVAPLPLGRGNVRTQHGPIPVPAPATAHLLRGFAVVDDGIAGERVTPTGAAILRHLAPETGVPGQATLAQTGTGAGQRDLPGIANICRLLHFETAPQADSICELAFEIDDMTPEEIAHALDHLRAVPGVVDAGYGVEYAKKGRMRFALRLLVCPDSADAVARACLAQTTTLGVRIGQARRLIAARTPTEIAGRRAKIAHRPTGDTVKVEADDLAPLPTLAERRKAGLADV